MGIFGIGQEGEGAGLTVLYLTERMNSSLFVAFYTASEILGNLLRSKFHILILSQ